MNHYIAYYENQIGGGSGGVRNVSAGSRWQRGSGIGSFSVGSARTILPFVAQQFRAVGKEALCRGINVLDDSGNKRRATDNITLALPPALKKRRRRKNKLASGNKKRRLLPARKNAVTVLLRKKQPIIAGREAHVARRKRA